LYRNLGHGLVSFCWPRVTEEHYNLSTNLSAGEEYALITQSCRHPLNFMPDTPKTAIYLFSFMINFDQQSRRPT
jgi:hypothetical protein